MEPPIRTRSEIDVRFGGGAASLESSARASNTSSSSGSRFLGFACSHAHAVAWIVICPPEVDWGAERYRPHLLFQARIARGISVRNGISLEWTAAVIRRGACPSRKTYTAWPAPSSSRLLAEGRHSRAAFGTSTAWSRYISPSPWTAKAW